MTIDFIYVISLITEPHDISVKIKDLKMKTDTPFYVVPAINGWDLQNGNIPSPYEKYNQAKWWKLKNNPNSAQNNWWSRDLTPGEIGCGLSHYSTIENAYNEGFENVLILEEDFYGNGDKFPEWELNHLIDDWSMCYLGRNALRPEKDIKVNEGLIQTSYSFNAHAYVLSRKGMKEIIDSNYLTNMIPWDEFLPAIAGVHDREDANKCFHNGFKQYALPKNYINQSSNYASDSLTEYTPDHVKEVQSKQADPVSEIVIPPSDQVQEVIATHNPDILNTDNWDEWCNKYISAQIRNEEYDLVIDEPCTHVYTFPFFTKAFCDELIILSEQFNWTHDRHEFHPTTDNLLEVLGMQGIYNRAINQFVRPLAIYKFQLDGKSWDELKDESFIIRYKPEEQAHLGLHHDHSHITTLVNLNPGEFKGGGTYFDKYKCNVNPKDIGVMTLHPGNITHKHGARPVTEGTRYVVVSFIKGNSEIY